MGQQFSSFDDFVYPGKSYIIDGVTHDPIPNLTVPTRKISDSLANKLKKMYVDLRTILDKNNIQHWVDFGTLLGTIRHKGFIPWDDDWDIKINFRDTHKLIQVFKNDKKYKLMYLNKNFCFIKLFPIDAPHMGVPFIDIFLDIEMNSKQGSCEFQNCLDSCNNIRIDKKDIFPLRKAKFEDIWVYIPNNPDKILKDKYGNYNEIVVVIPHSDYTIKEKGKIIAPYGGTEYFNL